jgi:hypothetical protein
MPRVQLVVPTQTSDEDDKKDRAEKIHHQVYLFLVTSAAVRL